MPTQTAWDAVLQWRDVLSTEATDHTARTYLHHVQTALIEIARTEGASRDEIELSACTPRMIRAHLSRYRTQPDQRYRSAGDAPAERAAASVRLRLRALRAFSRWCVETELAQQDFTAGVRVRSEAAGGVRPRHTLTLEQARLLLEQHPGLRGTRDHLLVALSLTLGCSAGEIAGLRLADLSPDRTELTLRGKSGRSRKAACPPLVQDALAGWLSVRSRIAAPGESALLLTRRGPLNAAGVSRVLVRRLAAIGLEGEGWTSHALRASCAQLALDAGAGVREVQQLLGLESLTAVRTLLQGAQAPAPLTHPLARG